MTDPSWDEIDAMIIKGIVEQKRVTNDQIIKYFKRINAREAYLKDFRIGKVLTLIEGILSCKNAG